MKNCYHISTVNLSKRRSETRGSCTGVFDCDCGLCGYTSREWPPIGFVLPPTTNGPFKKSSASSWYLFAEKGSLTWLLTASIMRARMRPRPDIASNGFSAARGHGRMKDFALWRIMPAARLDIAPIGQRVRVIRRNCAPKLKSWRTIWWMIRKKCFLCAHLACRRRHLFVINIFSAFCRRYALKRNSSPSSIIINIVRGKNKLISAPYYSRRN